MWSVRSGIYSEGAHSFGLRSTYHTADTFQTVPSFGRKNGSEKIKNISDFREGIV